MEHLRQDDPDQIGPYVTLARLDSEAAAHTVPERRYIARSTDGERTVVACLPLVGADPGRWAVEAEGARRLSLPGFLPVAEVGGTAGFPWYVTPYVPLLPLPAALAAHGGPLPEPCVRSLGAALAATLAAAHAQGVTHAGLAPAAVLLGTEGPYLGCYGTARSAGPDGEERRGLPGLDPGCLPPEQAQGGRPRPLGDAYALGAVLAYASTGHTVPERDELPPSLRSLIGACLSRDPAHRPQLDRLADEFRAMGSQLHDGTTQLSPSSQARPDAGHRPTVLDSAARPVPYPPLPARIVTALVRQSAELLAAPLPSHLVSRLVEAH
ncbi:serine/threonine protein kinase [Streptomyces sp. NPDC057291]|uniref:serine/threonine protein kinase n=1 Tax=Streptomyces sp. NPDC057291 TaxID=3346087 RepID=UPI00363A3F91